MSETTLVPVAPLTVVPQPGCVRVLAGEDLRFTVRGEGLETWLPAVLAALGPGVSGTEASAHAPLAQRNDALEILARLTTERLLVEQASSKPTAALTVEVVGEGPLASRLRDQLPAPDTGASGAPRLSLIVQSTLDYRWAREADLRAASEGHWRLWVSDGAAARGWVGPVMRPEGGPCLDCLLTAFERLSPEPELWRALLEHPGPFATSTVPEAARDILCRITAWKLSGATESDVPAAVHRLHVLELATFEVNSHVVPVDPDCPREHAAT
ncbi:MAG: TOMM precursor leader peptide-binding protein [Myxococcota bacterium]